MPIDQYPQKVALTMPEPFRSTMRSRALGDEIRIAMERANFSGKRLAERLGWSESKVSRTLTGSHPISDFDLASVLALCDVTGEKRDDLLNLARSDSLDHWETARNALMGQMRKVVRITELRESLVPNLLQIPDYTRSVLSRTTDFSFDEMESWITKIEHAQSTCSDEDTQPRCTFFVHERVLHLPVGNKAVMSEQLRHLLSVSTQRNFNIRVVPADFGAHPGMGNPFCLLEFADDLTPAIYDEDEVAGHFREEPERIACIRRVITGLAATAYDRPESRKVIQRVLADRYLDHDDRDDGPNVPAQLAAQ